MTGETSNEGKVLKPYLSGRGAWALALGTSVGWGSMVITGNTYLAQAGTAGSVIGLLIGTVIMLVIARCYHYMICCYPDAGGAYTYVKEVFSHDYGFVAAWFLLLAYMAVFWANATSLPLFMEYFVGDMFKFGISWSVLGYEMYLGEALLSVGAILLAAFLCTLPKRYIARVMIILSAAIMIGVTIGFMGGMVCYDNDGFSFQPAFIPDGKSPLAQSLYIACISPWAFIGFENISHSAEEFTFPKKKSFGVLALSVICSALVYIFVILLSVTAYPPEYDTWLDYIKDLGNLSGIKALPPFYAVHHYMGNVGLGILVGTLLALVVTSLLANIIALSRLLYALGRDKMIPSKLAELNRHGVPARAVVLIGAVSVIMPFFGRTAIGWIIDVTTISATLIYALVAGAAASMAKSRSDTKDMAYGIIGVALMAFFAAYILIPNLFSLGSMATESYILFTVWSVLGFVMFYMILRRDTAHRFGRSVVVWIVLQAMILFSALVWLNQSTLIATDKVIDEIEKHYMNTYSEKVPEVIQQTLSGLWGGLVQHMAVVVALFAVSLFMMLNNYRIMSKRASESEDQLGNMRNTAYRDPLTGVKSKIAFTEKESEINQLIAEERMELFCVVVCDVNGLKIVNDTKGHKAGDEYLREACMMVCKVFDHSPVYRTGGDEFVVIATGSDFEERYELLAELNKRVEDNIASGAAVIAAGISDFVAGQDKDLHSVMERADVLMYSRKKELKAMGSNSR